MGSMPGIFTTIFSDIADLTHLLPFAVAALVGLWAPRIFGHHSFPIFVDVIIGLIGGTLAVLSVAHYIDQKNITFGSESADDLFYAIIAAAGAAILLLIVRTVAVRRSA